MLPIIYRRFSIDTTAAPSEAAARLAAAVAPSPILGRPVTDRPFAGWVRGDEFKVSRVFRERLNSFVPVLRGRVVAAPGGSRLEGTMRFHHVVSVFLAVWSAGALWGVVTLLREAAHAPLRRGDLLGLLAMLLGFWALGIWALASEARKARYLLLQALEASEPRAVA